MKGLTLAVVAVAFLVGLWALGDGSKEAGAEVDPAELFQEQMDALNRGDVDGVMETFANDAHVGGVPGCSPLDCVGKDAIRNLMEYLVAANTRTTITSSRVSGNTATGSAEIESDGIRAAGVDRILGGVTVEVGDHKITDQRFIGVLTDPQTADWVAFLGANSIAVDLGPGRDSDQSPGTATLTGLGDRTDVFVTITPGPAGVPQPIHIHEGTCANLGGVGFSLQDIGGGRSLTNVNVPLGDLQASDFAINVHKSEEEADDYVACGDIDAVAPVEASPEVAAPADGPPVAGGGGLLGGGDGSIGIWWYALVAAGALLVVGGLAGLRRTRSRR